MTVEDSGNGLRDHIIRRKVTVHKDQQYRFEGGNLVHLGAEVDEVENYVKRRCSCGEVFHSDEKALEHLSAVREAGADV